MKKRIWVLLLPIIAIVLQILPYGAVLNFGNPDGLPRRETFSYFSLVPFGYANFAPLLTSIATCLVFALLNVYCFTGKYTIIKITKILLLVATVLSLCPLIYGLTYFSIVGGLITATLFSELVLLYVLFKRMHRQN